MLSRAQEKCKMKTRDVNFYLRPPNILTVHVIIGRQMYFTVSDLLGDILSLKRDTKDLDQFLSLRVPKFAPPSSPTEVLDFRNRGAETNRLRIQSGRKANELTMPLEGVPKVTSGKLLTALPPIIPREGVGLLEK